MKKLFTILTALAAVVLGGVLLASCGNGAKGYKYTPKKVDYKGKAIDLFLYKKADPFISGSVEPGFDAALAAAGFGTVKAFDANEDQAQQNNQIRTALSSQDGFLVNSAQPNGAGGIIDIIAPKNKPIVFFNREMDNDAIKKYNGAYFVGTDRKQPGELQGDYVAKQLIEHFGDWDKNHDGQLEFYLLFGQSGNPEAIGRTEGFKLQVEKKFKELYDKLSDADKKKNGLDKYKPGTDVVKQIGENYDANWSSDKAKAAVQALLNDTSVSLEAVISNNDGMALGALTALNEKGFNLGFKTGTTEYDYAKTVIVTGVDGLKDAVNAIKAGKLQFSVKQDGSLLAKVAVDTLVNLFNEKAAFEGLEAKYGAKIDAENAQKIRVPYSPLTYDIVKNM